MGAWENEIISNFTKLHLTREISRIIPVFSQFLWNLMFIFSNSQEKFSLVLLCISQFQLHPVPRGGAFANFALPEGRAFANPSPSTGRSWNWLMYCRWLLITSLDLKKCEEEFPGGFRLNFYFSVLLCSSGENFFLSKVRKFKFIWSVGEICYLLLASVTIFWAFM